MNRPANLRTVEDALNELPSDTLHMAMARAFAEIEVATKGAENPAFKQGGKVSKYADLTSIIDAIKPALINNGLFFTQRCQPAEDGVSVETVLHHRGGEKESLGILYVPANKRDPQGFGSALTYARRYALQTAFGVPTEDDDGNSAARATHSVAASTNTPAALVTDKQRDLIQQLAPGAGKTPQDLCDAYKIQSLKELTFAQADKLIGRLREQSKEPVNA